MNSKDLIKSFTRSGINPNLGEVDRGKTQLTDEEAKKAQAIYKIYQRDGWNAIQEWIEKSIERQNVNPADISRNSADPEKNIHYNAGYINALEDLMHFVEQQEELINNPKYYVPDEDS